MHTYLAYLYNSQPQNPIPLRIFLSFSPFFSPHVRLSSRPSTPSLPISAQNDNVLREKETGHAVGSALRLPFRARRMNRVDLLHAILFMRFYGLSVPFVEITVTRSIMCMLHYIYMYMHICGRIETHLFVVVFSFPRLFHIFPCNDASIDAVTQRLDAVVGERKTPLRFRLMQPSLSLLVVD